MATILLLALSNIFMTFAWYGHLKYLHDKPLWIVVPIAWGIAFFEYCLMVPANRMGYAHYTGYQLKIMQEVLTLVVFVVFAWLVLGEKLRWNYAVSMLFILLAVVFAFAFDKPAAPAAWTGLAIGQEVSPPDFRCRFCPLRSCPTDTPKKVS